MLGPLGQDQSLFGGPKDYINRRILQVMLYGMSSYPALEPGCRIITFMWSLGALLQSLVMTCQQAQDALFSRQPVLKKPIRLALIFHLGSLASSQLSALTETKTIEKHSGKVLTANQKTARNHVNFVARALGL